MKEIGERLIFVSAVGLEILAAVLWSMMIF